ncbi:hypothetical protein [Rhizobium sp.]
MRQANAEARYGYRRRAEFAAISSHMNMIEYGGRVVISFIPIPSQSVLPGAGEPVMKSMATRRDIGLDVRDGVVQWQADVIFLAPLQASVPAAAAGTRSVETPAAISA